MQEIIIADISKSYPDVAINEGNDLMDLLIYYYHKIHKTNEIFIPILGVGILDYAATHLHNGTR